MYESDRVSNGENTSTSCFLLNSCISVSNLSSPAEDSGNSSDNSESDDEPEKMDRLSPWQETAEAPPSQPEEEPEGEKKTMEESDVIVSIATSPLLPSAADCPSMLQENSEEVLSQSEKQQGEEPGVMSSHLDRVSPMSTPDRTKMSPGQEVLLQTSPSRMLPQQLASLSPRIMEDHAHSPVLSSPKVKGRRAILKETSSEAPPTLPLCSTSPTHNSPPSPPRAVVLPSRSVLKRQEEPMVVLHCLPTQHLPPKSPSANSDTDSATEEEELALQERSTTTQEQEEEKLTLQERSNSATKRKAAEEELLPQERSSSSPRKKGSEKKLCPEKRQEEAPSLSKPPRSPLCPNKRSDEGLNAEEEAPSLEKEVQTKFAEELLVDGTIKEAEVHAGNPPPAAEDPTPLEEVEPQMGPDSLVCHEVDLDDPDEKEKPISSAEHLLLMVREEQQALPTLPLVVHSSLPPHLPKAQVRPFLIAANPVPCSEDLPLVTGGGQGGDSSPGFEGSTSSSSTCLLSLQDNKDRGRVWGDSTSL